MYAVQGGFDKVSEYNDYFLAVLLVSNPDFDVQNKNQKQKRKAELGNLESAKEIPRIDDPKERYPGKISFGAIKRKMKNFGIFAQFYSLPSWKRKILTRSRGCS